MDRRGDTAINAVLEQLTAHGPAGTAGAIACTFGIAMRIERERFPATHRHQNRGS